MEKEKATHTKQKTAISRVLVVSNFQDALAEIFECGEEAQSLIVEYLQSQDTDERLELLGNVIDCIRNIYRVSAVQRELLYDMYNLEFDTEYGEDKNREQA
jgi:hypothetical protein